MFISCICSSCLEIFNDPYTCSIHELDCAGCDGELHSTSHKDQKDTAIRRSRQCKNCNKTFDDKNQSNHHWCKEDNCCSQGFVVSDWMKNWLSVFMAYRLTEREGDNLKAVDIV